MALSPKDELVIRKGIQDGKFDEQTTEIMINALKGDEGALSQISPSTPYSALKNRLSSKRKNKITTSGKDYFDKDVDYKTGVQNLGFRSKWARRDNDEERDLFLNKSVGEKGIDWDRDTQGRYVLTPRGQQKIGLNATEKKLPIDETGMSFDDVIEFFSAYGAPIALGTAGAIAAPLTGGASLGVLPYLGLTSLGAGAGTFAGVLADEGIEAIEGYQAEKATDVFQRAALEALFAAAAEGVVGGAILGGLRVAKGPGASLTPGLGGARGEATQSNFAEAILKKDKSLLPPEIAKGKGSLFETILDPANANKVVEIEGQQVTLGQLGQDVANMMPNVKNLSDKEILATAQKVAEVIFPNKKAQARNAQAFASAIRAMKGMLNKKKTLNPSDIQKALNDAFPDDKVLKENIDVTSNKLTQLLQEAFGKKGVKSIKGRKGSPKLLDENEIAQRIEVGKRIFQNQTNAGYLAVENLLNNVSKDFLPKLNSDGLLFSKIADELDEISKTVFNGKELKKFSDFLRTKTKPSSSLSELNHIRSVLRGVAFDGTIDDAAKKAAREGVKTLDKKINFFKEQLGTLARSKSGRGIKKGVKRDVEKAFKVLDDTEQFYKDGIGKFRSKEIEEILIKAQADGLRFDDIVNLVGDKKGLNLLLNVMNPTRLKTFQPFKDRRLTQAIKFSETESPLVTNYINKNLRANASEQTINNDPFVQYMRAAQKENMEINKLINETLGKGSTRTDQLLKKSLAAAHWTRMFGDEALTNSKGFGLQPKGGVSEIGVESQMVINPKNLWKEFTENKYALEEIYGKTEYKELVDILKTMKDDAVDALPLSNFTDIAGKRAGTLINRLKEQKQALDFQQTRGDTVRAILAARNNPDALSQLGKRFIKADVSPTEVTELKSVLITNGGLSKQQADDLFTDMALEKILPTADQLAGDDLMNGIITNQLDNFVGDGAKYNRELLEELFGGGQQGKIVYDNLKDLWRYSKLISESSTRGLSALKGASERTALAGFALLFAPGATLTTAIGSYGLRALLRSPQAMKFLATRPRGVKTEDEILAKSNFIKRLTTRGITQPIAGETSRGQQRAQDYIEEQAKEVFKEATPEGTEQVTETQTETVRPKKVSMPMPPPQSNPPGIERKIALGAAGNSPLNQALLRSRSV